MKKCCLFVLLLLLPVFAGYTQIRLPSIIGDNMVLQRSSDVNIWGWASPSAKIRLRTSWNSGTYACRAGEDGKWQISIRTPDAGGPHTIEITSSKESVVLKDILIGEVWICSGQSNMEMPVHGFYGQPVEDSAEQMYEACQFPGIRLFTIPPTPMPEPQDDCSGSWLKSTPRNVGDFSATGYFFGKYLYRVLGVPVGLITTNVGGIAIEPWMTEEAIKRTEGIDYKGSLTPRADHDAARPSYLYNGMIAPITRFRAKGFIWYQGESNQHNYYDYDKLMASMVRLWRKEWGDEKMPFYYVQLVPFTYDSVDGISLPLTVEAQYRALELIPDSGIVATTDLGHATAIHSPYKKQVGQRLASLALGHTYGVTPPLPDAPGVEGVVFENGRAVVTFSNIPPYYPAAWGTFDYFNGEPRGFELSGMDRKFYPAKARFVENRNMIEVYCDSVPEPVALRYAFRNFPDANVMTTEGQPLAPFRTDDWDDVY